MPSQRPDRSMAARSEGTTLSLLGTAALIGDAGLIRPPSAAIVEKGDR